MLATLIAPSKTFNLAGLQNAAVVIPDIKVRSKYDKFVAGIRVLYGNTLGYVAAEAAFKSGRPWLEALLKIIQENDRCVRKILHKGVPGIFIPELQGTYLLWLDFSKCLKPHSMADFFEKRCRVAMDYGDWFGGNPCCVRMNLATSPEIICSTADTIVREYARFKAEG
jgi:cystathionine beta-lyase